MIVYKFNVLGYLKENGYNTNRIRKENIFPQSVLQRLRNNEMVSMSTLDQICRLLDMQPGNIIKYVDDDSK